MSTQKISTKPLTGTFELQTKIRVIIQDVMSATVRKVSQCSQKIQTFQQFFFTYKQRIQEIENRSKQNQQINQKMQQQLMGDKQSMQTNFLKYQQNLQKHKIEKNQQDAHMKQLNRKMSALSRQSEATNNQLSKTKAKFLEISDQMSALKQDVAWKITKYIQQTAEANTQVRITSEQIKKEYFNVTLALAKNKQKYEEIISHRDEQQNFNKCIREEIDKLQFEIKQQKKRVNSFNTKLQEMDTALYSKIKQTQSKLQKRIEELEQNNKFIHKSIKKVQKFSELLQQIKEDSQRIRRQLLKKFEESDQRHNDLLEQEMLTLNKKILDYQKTIDKKIKHINENLEKSVDFLTEKLDYLKIQIEAELSSKTTKMLQQKSKSQSGASNIIVEQLTEKINKLALQAVKNTNKLQGMVKQTKNEIRNRLEQTNEKVQQKVSNSMKLVEQSVKGGIDPEVLHGINMRIQNISDQVQLKILEMDKGFNEQNSRVNQVQKVKQDTQKSFSQFRKQNSQKYIALEQKVNNRVEKVMFLVTKMRGDAIIKNQFVQKQIKQLKKITSKQCQQITSINKLIPAFGECINLVMCLIFDAEYQHSRIIQDSLGLVSEQVKFQNILEGVLYQYSDKKKPGIIIYRHRQLKKMEVVKNTFEAMIRVWEQLYQNDFKNKIHMIPKTFYKNQIEKGKPNRESPKKNSNAHRQYVSNKELGAPNDESNDPLANSTNNRSFHIRKKKNNVIRSKDQLLMVVSEDIQNKINEDVAIVNQQI